MNGSLPISSGELHLDDLDDEELEGLYDSLRQRFKSLTRCISECQKRRYRPLPIYTSDSLEDTYHSTLEITPPWFRALFMKGPQTFELIPTFPPGLPRTSREYQDLAAATFKVTMSFIDNSRGVHGGLFVTEILKPGSHVHYTPSIRCASAKSRLNYSEHKMASKSGKSKDFADQSNESSRHSTQSKTAVPTSDIYSNHSGVATQPAGCCRNTVWLTNYSYNVLPQKPVYKRRIVMSGKFEMNKDETLFEKRFRIIFLLGTDDQVRGIYRRQMTSEACFLTWRIIFP